MIRERALRQIEEAKRQFIEWIEGDVRIRYYLYQEEYMAAVGENDFEPIVRGRVVDLPGVRAGAQAPRARTRAAGEAARGARAQTTRGLLVLRSAPQRGRVPRMRGAEMMTAALGAWRASGEAE